MAQRLDAPVLLRVEDIDTTRCRPAFDTAMLEDLWWLGFTWQEPVLRQSERGTAYAEAADRLRALEGCSILSLPPRYRSGLGRDAGVRARRPAISAPAVD